MARKVLVGLLIISLIGYVLFQQMELEILDYYLTKLHIANLILEDDLIELQQYVYKLKHLAM